MSIREPILPLATIKRIMKLAGVERVSDDAADEIRRFVEELIISLTKDAHRIAKHAGRKTVTREDVKLVLNLRRLYKII